eukprot:scaffold46851_cov33-Tisochrysis_lutea.AAC.5
MQHLHRPSLSLPVYSLALPPADLIPTCDLPPADSFPAHPMTHTASEVIKFRAKSSSVSAGSAGRCSREAKELSFNLSVDSFDANPRNARSAPSCNSFHPRWSSVRDLRAPTALSGSGTDATPELPMELTSELEPLHALVEHPWPLLPALRPSELRSRCRVSRVDASPRSGSVVVSPVPEALSSVSFVSDSSLKALTPSSPSCGLLSMRSRLRFGKPSRPGTPELRGASSRLDCRSRVTRVSDGPIPRTEVSALQ